MDKATKAHGPASGAQVVVPLMGLPGAGKSVVANCLVQRLGLRRLDRDLVRAAMFPVCSYSSPEKRAAFRGVLLALEINCLLGESSVIDGMTFARLRDLEKVEERARKFSTRVIPIWLDVPAQVARARITEDKRAGGHPAADREAAVVDMVLSRFERPPASIATIDATLPRERVCELAVAIVLRAAPHLANT